MVATTGIVDQPWGGSAVATPIPHICLFGAPLDTGNLGVSALGVSTIAALSRRLARPELTWFDNGRGLREAALRLPDGSVGYSARGAWLSRRVYRRECLWSMHAASLSVPALNPNVRALSGATCVLDISGGDSFCDLYGRKRFHQVTLPKRIALRLGRPLVLLPQTYGPFRSPSSRQTARSVTAAAAQVWARDEDSYHRLQALLGDAFDPQRHRRGVDVAFTLPAVDPGPVVDDLRGWLAADDPVIGLNVSGLMFNDPAAAAARFELTVDYPATMRGFVSRALAAGLRVVLVPHVRGPSRESDDEACETLVASLDHPERLRTLPPGLDANATKWIISRLDWFTGARMHATIAAMSSQVPVAGVAYSDKMRGVFASCGIGDEVVDAKTLDSVTFEEALWDAFERRDAVAARLRRAMPGVLEAADSQFDDIAAYVSRAVEAAVPA